MRAMGMLAACLLALAPAANATSLAFDFDADGDPTTVQSAIDAEAGELVRALLVVEDLPTGHAYLHGLQYGLSLTPGLTFVGMSIVGLQGGMGHDGGHAGIVVVLDEPLAASELPSFAMEFVLEVTDDTTPQSVRIVPSTWQGQTAGGFIYLVSHTPGGPLFELEHAGAIATQQVGRVNGDATPSIEVSWSALKGHF